MRNGTNFVGRYGPWAVVTGASSGIGRDLARLLAKSGLHVILTARTIEALRSLEAEIGAHGRDCKVVPLDLSKPESPSILLKEAEGMDVGLLVHSAGFGSAGPFLERESAA